MTRFLQDWPRHALGPVWLTIGNFDGVHLGHQALINRLKTLAAEDGSSSVVMSFWPHPYLLFNPQARHYLLDSSQEKKTHLSALEPDMVLTLPFTQGLAETDARSFFKEMTLHMTLKGLIVGRGFSLGKGRRGGAAQLRALCKTFGAQFIEMDSLSVHGRRVSSGLIREALLEGRVDQAASLLGRPFSVTSTVRVGKKLGSRLGIPTANQLVDPSKILPKFGVYASWAYLGGQRFMGVTSVGVRPTVEEEGQPNIETWILDFDGNIYGEELKLEFIKFLRDEQKFPSVEDMIKQIKTDASKAREELTNAP